MAKKRGEKFYIHAVANHYLEKPELSVFAGWLLEFWLNIKMTFTQPLSYSFLEKKSHFLSISSHFRTAA